MIDRDEDVKFLVNIENKKKGEKRMESYNEERLKEMMLLEMDGNSED